jgi:DEAD/DEAH box helicase domain-containing protein
MPAVNVSDVVQILTKAGLTPSETAILPSRQAIHRPIPSTLHADIKAELSYRFPGGLYSHQADAIQEVLEGADVCLATQAASGKSLVFMTAASELLLRRRSARVLALYPAKALIQDQLAKWTTFLAPFGAQVGFIDGSVPIASRPAILSSCRVVAMTPDVAHAWLMSHLGTKEVAQFLHDLGLLILDEAHVYDGAFGTNMAYFLRRLGLASGDHRLICSTATIGAPEGFMHRLTGRNMVVFDEDRDTSALPEKTLLLARSTTKGGFDRTVQLLAGLSEYGKGRFLAFGDSRKAVERIVGAVLRQNAAPPAADEKDEEDDESAGTEEAENWPKLEHILPYRAGYETSDREAIQRALTEGSLAGVVSTSALELGLDIGDLDIVVLLNTPPTIKAFRQRIGRAGRRRDAVCILIDDQGIMTPLTQYLARPPEPSWLYLENSYIQYSNALCAAVELQARGVKSTAGLDLAGLPETFPRLLENEVNPTAAVDPDLYGLKQRAQGNPHYEFPIRAAAEPNFEVEGPFGLKLGSLSYGQALREAYPGAVYYYMARPFRVQSLEYKKGLIKASRSKYFSTKPLADTMAFPDFRNGVIASWRSPDGFLAEVELQVSERVRGFVEQRGQNKMPPHEYGPGSPYSQRPLWRLIKTTGICWAFPSKLDRSEIAGELIMSAFAFTCGVHERDLGVALFHANEGPFSPEQVKGTVVFDATNGSLRLTERLARQFAEVVDFATEQTQPDTPLREELITLRRLVAALQPSSTASAAQPSATEGDWIRVIDRNQPAMFLSGEAPSEVTVLDFRYTPHGLMYQLESLKDAGYTMVVDKGKLVSEKTVVKNPPVKWMVLASLVQPLGGVTQMVRYNVVTGEEAPDQAAKQ